MSGLLRVYAVVTLCGWAVLPILARGLGRTPDRGYALSRCFGWVLSAWLAWTLSWLTGRPLTTALALGAILIVAAASWLPLLVRRRPTAKSGCGTDRPIFLPPPRIILCIEILFLAGILLFGFLQSRNPAIDPDSERFMDYAYIESCLRSQGLPVMDPWMAGRETVYYHFGYALVAFLVRACGAEPVRLFIAAIALSHALVWISAFHVGASLTGRGRGGILASFLVLGAGNLAWLRQGMGAFHVQGFDWFASSRVIEGTITEFPWFSLLWGDLHPYVLALPIVICALAFPLCGAIEAGVNSPAESLLWRMVGFAVAAGAALAVHPWDFPLLVGATLVLVAGRGRAGLTRLLSMLLAAVASILLFLPFLRGPASGLRGLGWVVHRSDPREWLMAYGPFVLVAILGAFCLVMSKGWRAIEWRKGSRTERHSLVLAACGLVTAMSGELVYVRDLFEPTPLQRMNTVFKLHRFAWLLLAFASSVCLDRLAQGARGRPALRMALIVVLGASLVYPVFGTASWLRARRDEMNRQNDDVSRTALAPWAAADALFRATSPGDAAAASFIAARARPADAVLEETGAPYTWSSRISTFTGVPAVLGWGNHEAVWRQGWDEVLRRQEDVAFLYGHMGSREACDRLRSYGVEWVVVGERERLRYGPVTGEATRRARPAHEQAGTAVYRAEDLCGAANGSPP